jgi:integrase
MPIYNLAPNRWRVVVVVNKHRRDRIVEGSRDDALALEARERVEMAQHAPSDNRTAPPFSAFCADKYQPHAEASLARQTYTNRTYQIATLIQFFGDLRMDKIDRARVDAFVAARRAAGIGATTINDDLKVLKRVVSYAIELGAPMRPLKVPALKVRAKAVRVKAWSADDVAALFAAVEAESPAILPLVVFLANTGCRKTEALRLRWAAVDFASGVAHVESVAEDDDEDVAEWEPKDGEVRQVPLGPTLRPWLERLRSENKRRKKPSAFVFASRRGKPWRTWPQLQFDRARKAAGLVGGPHMLRHTFATHFLAARPDLFLLSKILGHSHERTTLLYSHLLPGTVAAAGAVVSFAPGVGPAEATARETWRK